jgi:sialate O-acetylesterase
MRMNLALKNRTLLTSAIAAWIAGTPAAARAEVKPNSLFSDGAVLQQGVAVPVWGTANDGEKVTIKFEQQTVTATTKDGRWLVRLKPLKAGGPFTLTVAGENNTLTFTNVLVVEHGL